MQKMKSALMISGAFRFENSGIPSVIENIIKIINCDVFIDAWSTFFPFKEKGYNKEQINFNSFSLIPNLKFVKICEEPKDKLLPLSNQEACAKNFLKMTYKMNECCNLVKEWEELNGFKYDFCIRARIDLKYKYHLNLNIFNSIKANEVIIPKCQIFSNFNDQWFAGKRDEMIQVCSIHNKVEEYYNNGISFHPETMMFHHVKQLNFSIKIDEIVEYEILRPWNN